jgi:hypothetical protein
MKNRYLMVTFVRKPNGQIDEMITVGKRIKNSDTQTSNIICDFKEKKIIKSVIESKVLTLEWDKVLEYYKRVYPVLIAQLEKEQSEE